MSRFWAGFAVASVLWAGAGVALYVTVGIGEPEPAPLAAAPAPEPAEVEEDTDEPSERRRGRRRGRARAGEPRSAAATPTGSGERGDDLGDDEARRVDMSASGGEQQLRPAQIDAGFGASMGAVRRCLVLIPGDAQVRGRVTFGLRIAGTGRVTRAHLSGPRAVTTGECGECLERVARGMRFDTFDGPEMIVRYPLDLE
ncbi:MAG: hypothetical protein KF729_07355 [Sandaracinaceae bacterium]|nr:hypothetical protein [Sandaracinaceae bacterium]